MTISKELLAQANLTEYTDEEIQQQRQLIHKLIDEEKIKEAGMIDYPFSVWQLDNMKQLYGIEQLIKDGVNLSNAVKEYGYEWLTN